MTHADCKTAILDLIIQLTLHSSSYQIKLAVILNQSQQNEQHVGEGMCLNMACQLASIAILAYMPYSHAKVMSSHGFSCHCYADDTQLILLRILSLSMSVRHITMDGSSSPENKIPARPSRCVSLEMHPRVKILSTP